MKAEPRAIECHHCDFGSGRRGMDRCPTCDGTGALFRVAARYFPNTEAGYRAALEEMATTDRQGGER